ncbi:leucine-rich repeat protein [bacterium]|nr:leucine-rich repeat protein [bacterium]
MKKLSLLALISVIILALLIVPFFVFYDNATSTSDFQFELNEDNKSYTLQKFIGRTTKIKIPAEYKGLPIKVIAHDAFRETEITSLIIPEGIEEIGYSAFYGCRNLLSVTVPSTVRSIPEWAFGGCEKLKSVEIKEGVERVDTSAFAASGIEEITLPNSIKKVGNSAFEYCQSLVKVDFGKNTETIGSRVCYNCDRLTTVVIHENILHIGKEAFHSSPVTYNADGGLNYLGNDTNPFIVLMCARPIYEENWPYDFYFVNTNCKCIASAAFNGCYEIKNIFIPDGLRGLGEAAFTSCLSLKQIVIGKDLVYCGDFLFRENDNLDSIFINGDESELSAATQKMILSLSSSYSTENTKVYYYSENPPQKEGNYWHMVDDMPISW